MRRLSNFYFVLLLVALLGPALFMLFSPAPGAQSGARDNDKLRQDIARLKQSNKKLRQQNEELRRVLATAKQNPKAHAEAAARETFLMIKPGEVYVVPTDDGEISVVSDDEDGQ